MKDNKVKWKHLLEFIEKKVQEDPNFLENQLMIEMVPPEHCPVEGNWKRTKDSEGWHYVEPAWQCGEKIEVLATTFTDQKIVTLNINY